MKKIDLMLKVLFLVAFANVSFGQVGPYFGGATCADAVPITVDAGYVSNSSGADDWYAFTAPCDGELEITNCPYGGNKDVRIHSGVCGSLTVEATAGWLDCATPTVEMAAGDVVYVEVFDDWTTAPVTFDVNFENPACPQPTSLDGFTPTYNTANLAWFGSGETEWVVTYGPTGFDPLVSGTSVTVLGAPSTTISGLEELTCYDYYVQAVCGGGEVSCFLSGPYTFCTPAICPAPLFLSADDVTNTTTTLNWSAGDSESLWDVNWGPEGFLIGDEDFTEDTPFNTQALTDLDPSTCYDFYVRAECEVDLGGGPEFVNSLWVGPIEWCTESNCLMPTGGTLIAEDGLSATLGWTANNTPEEEEWNIQYGAPGFALGSGVTVTNIPTNPFTLGGLDPDTEYCYYVQAVCGEGPDSLSGWNGPFCFETSVYCEEPSLLFAESTSSTEADLEWVAGGSETSWEISYGLGLDDPTAGTMEDIDVFPSISLAGLEAGETYCYYVRGYCGDAIDSASTWAGPFCWTQDALCATPFAVDVINITNTAAFVDFASIDAESFDISWGEPCFEPGGAGEVGSVAGTTDDPYYMIDLDHSTPYWVYVRATCGVDSVSNYTAPFLFGTDIANDNPCDAEELVLDGPMIVRHNFEATVLPGETALLPPSAGCTDDAGWCSGDGVDRTVWFKFDAPPSGQVNLTTFDESECVTNGYTEIAIYSTGDCAVITNFELEAANSLDPEAFGAPFGSTITACGLVPGETYYVMVNPIASIQEDVHFGIALASVEEVNAGLGLSPTICAGESYDLFNSIAGYTEGGQWYNPTVATGNELPNLVAFPDVAGSFDLFYVVSNGCDADTVMSVVSTVEGTDAGGDGFFTACVGYNVVLSDHIVGSYDGGGIWAYTGTDPDVALAGGFFNTTGLTAGVYEFLYTVANEFCAADSAIVTITVEGCEGVDENGQDILSVYPNPVVDVLTVQNVAIDGNAVIEVLDVEGRVIISNNVSNVFGNYTIDMTTIESGVYFVKVTTDNNVQKVRVVKK